jgi:hypothetical protein
MLAVGHEEEEIARRLRDLKPAPSDWVQAAKDLPEFRRTVEDLALLAEADADVRAAMLADLEAAVREQGVEPTPRLLAELRERLA